jgi:hypothetical protein
MYVQVPRIKILDHGRAVVHRWGRVGETSLRSGDRLVIGPETAGGLLLLVPRGHGRPMLGRRSGSQLIAEPGGVPASARRWRVMGSVIALEREQERSVLDTGRWFLCTRIEATNPDSNLSEARKIFIGGWKTASQIDALTLRAAIAPEAWQVEVACAAARTPERAGELLSDTPTGSIRIALEDCPANDSASIIPGPWPREVAMQTPDDLRRRVMQCNGTTLGAGVQLGLFGDSRLMHAC